MATTGSAEQPGAPLAWGVIAGSVLLGLGWVTLAQMIAPTITIASEIAANTLFYLILFAPLALIATVAAMLLRRSAFVIGESAGLWIGVGAGIGAAGLLMSLLLSWLQGGVVPGGVASPGFAIVLLGMVLILFQTGVEELFFRGWLQPALIARTSPVVGIAVATLCFTAFHLVGGARAPISIVNIALAGSLFGLLAWRSGGLAAPIAAHFAWNVVESSGLGLIPNPGADVFGSLLDLDLLGTPLWGGQEEGLNASIGTSAVLLALIVPLAWRPATPKLQPSPA